MKTIVDTLRGGDWVGPGATAFYREMDASVFPSLNRLGASLGEAADATNKINQLMNGAERDAAIVLRGAGEDNLRHKEGDTVVGASALSGGILSGIVGGVIGAVIGQAAGAAASEKIDDYMDAIEERAAEDQARHDVIQAFIDSGDRQGAIDLAIELHGLDVSAAKGAITYDSDVDEDGATNADGTVKIGTEAFSSPGWLASSIGHEVLHAEQARDGRWNNSKQGVAMNEVEAYDWEIRNADRFGLTDTEKATINRRRDTKYSRLNLINKAFADAGIYTIP